MPFWMAAIYRLIDGVSLPLFTILTMDASASVAPIHNRMPVIWRNREARIAWLKGNNNMKELIHEATVRDIMYRLAI